METIHYCLPHFGETRRVAVALILSAALAGGSPAYCGPIHDAARDGDLKRVALLLKANPNLVFSTDEKYGQTPLHIAAFNDRKDVAELLLASKADVNAKAKNGSTPLHLAAAKGNKDLVELLLASRADVNAVDNDGWSPMHSATVWNQKDIGEFLRLYGGQDLPAPKQPPLAPSPRATGAAEVVPVQKQIAVPVPDCAGYLQQEIERTSRQLQISRLQTELSDLQTRYQAVAQQASEDNKNANLDSFASVFQKGWVNVLDRTMAGTLRLRAQQEQTEAQNLQLQVTLKQSELTTAQIGSYSPLTGPPPGCAGNPATPVSVVPAWAEPDAGEQYKEGVALYNQNRYKEARPLLQEACDGGEMDGCFKLGHLYNSGEGVPRDFAQGCSLWRKACDGGLGAGCFNFRTAECSTSSAASAEPTVHDEVEKIRSGAYAPMPPAYRSSVSRAASGGTMMTVQNSTAYQLSVFYDGPVSTKLTLAPGASQTIDLAPGAFHVAGRVSASDVLPFYGEETYAGSASYSETFYIR